MDLVWFQFILGAVFIIFAGTKLTNNADTIARITGLGAGWAGVLLLPLATSLPELVTSFRSLMIQAPDLAVGNLLGSNLFNITAIALVDLLQGRGSLFVRIKKGHILSATLGILVIALCIAGIVIPFPSILGWLGLDTILIFMVYLSAIYVITKHERDGLDRESMESDEKYKKYNELFTPITKFGLSALVILLAGIVVTDAADVIAVETGLGRTFVGSILLAVSTSLPELVTVSSAARLGKFDMAVGNIFGANLLNMFILFVMDISYLNAPLLRVVSIEHVVTAIMGIVLTAIAIIGLSYRSQKCIWWLSYYSVFIIVGYIVAFAALFFAGISVAV